eukprot:COSAG01_NODE_1036_length_11988_cov_10.055345_7_plen_290_part_00
MPNQPEPSRGSGKCCAVQCSRLAACLAAGAQPPRVNLDGPQPPCSTRASTPAAAGAMPVDWDAYCERRHANFLAYLEATLGKDAAETMRRTPPPRTLPRHAPAPLLPRAAAIGSAARARLGFIQLAEKKKGAAPFELCLDDELRGQVRGHVLGYDPGDCVVVGFDCGGASEFRVVPVVCLPREMVRALDITLAQRTAETETATAGYSHSDFTVGGYPSRTQAIYLLTNEAKPLAGRTVNGPMRDLLVRRVRYARAHNGTAKVVWRLFWTQAPGAPPKSKPRIFSSHPPP